MKNQYKKLKKLINQIKYALNYPDNQSKKYDRECDKSFYNFCDIIISIVWKVFIIISSVNIFYFIKYYILKG
jgi:hypothetical protein